MSRKMFHSILGGWVAVSLVSIPDCLRCFSSSSSIVRFGSSCFSSGKEVWPCRAFHPSWIMGFTRLLDVSSVYTRVQVARLSKTTRDVGRTLSQGGYDDDGGMTDESCIAYCSEQGYIYAGTEVRLFPY